MVEARILQRVGCLAHVKLDQSRLPLSRRMGLSEICDHCAQRLAPAVDDRRAEHCAESHLRGCINKGKISSGTFNVFDQGAPVHGKEICRDIAK